MNNKERKPYDDGWIAWQCDLTQQLQRHNIKITDVDGQLMEHLYLQTANVAEAANRIDRVFVRYKALLPTAGDMQFIKEDITPECLGPGKCRFICGGGVGHCRACGYVDDVGCGL